MADAVKIRFQVDGIDQVRASLRTVEEALVRAERNAAQATAQATRQRVTAAEREARERQRIEERAAKEKIDILRRADQMQERAQREAVREVERAEKDKTRALEREAAERIRVVERETRAAQQMYQRLAGAAAHGYGAGRAITNRIAGGVVSTALGLGGGFSIADSLRDTQHARRQAALLSNNAPGTPADLAGADPRRADPKKLMERAAMISKMTGVSESDLLEAATLHVKRSSDLDAAMSSLPLFAKMAVATGSDVTKIADTAGKLQKQNPTMTARETNDMLLGMLQAGKLGTITMDEMAPVAGKITRTRSAYKGDVTKNQTELLGLAQIAARSGDSPSAVATTVSNLSQDVIKHSAKINAIAAGGRITDEKTGQINMSPGELIARLFEKSGGNLDKLTGMGINVRSNKLFQELQKTFEEGGGYQNAKRGADAVRKELSPVLGAKYDEKKLEEDFKAVEATQQFERALMDLKQTMGTALLPEFEKLIPTIKEMAPLFVDVARTGLPAFVDFVKSVAELVKGHQAEIHWLASHPMATIVGSELGKSLGPAVLGEILKSGFAKQFGAAGAAGIAIGTAYLAIEHLAEQDKKVTDSGVQNVTSGVNSRSELARPDGMNITQRREAIENAKQHVAELKASIAETEKNKGGSDLLYGAALVGTTLPLGAAISKVAGGTDVRDVVGARKERVAQDEASIAAQKRELDQLTKSIAAAEKALAKLAGSAEGVPNARGGAPPADGLAHPSRGGVRQ